MSPVQQSVNSPIIPPPPGQTTDLNAQNPFHVVTIVLATIFISISGIVVLVRLFTQYFLSKGLSVEDYLIVFAWLVQLAAFIDTIVNRQYVGQHIWHLTIGDVEKVLKAINTVSVLYAVIIGLIKIAILLQYLRIFTSKQINRSLRIACWIWITVNALYYMIDMLLEIMQCLPRENIWNLLSASPGHCLSIYDIWVGTGIFNTISDVVILLLPLPAIARLQLPTRKKFYVTAIFATGSIACAASAVRTYYTWRTLESSDIDQTYYMEYVGIWIWIEMFIGILVFCLPTTPQFFLFIGSKTRSLYTVISTRSTFFSGLSTRKGSWSSTSDSAEMKVVVSAPPPLPFIDVSLASFEQRLPATREDTDIHVMRSVSQIVETIGEVEACKLDLA